MSSFDVPSHFDQRRTGPSRAMWLRSYIAPKDIDPFTLVANAFTAVTMHFLCWFGREDNTEEQRLDVLASYEFELFSILACLPNVVLVRLYDEYKRQSALKGRPDDSTRIWSHPRLRFFESVKREYDSRKLHKSDMFRDYVKTCMVELDTTGLKLSVPKEEGVDRQTVLWVREELKEFHDTRGLIPKLDAIVDTIGVVLARLAIFPYEMRADLMHSTAYAYRIVGFSAEVEVHAYNATHVLMWKRFRDPVLHDQALEFEKKLFEG